MYPSHFLERFPAPLLFIMVFVLIGCSPQSGEVLRVAYRNNAARIPLMLAKRESLFHTLDLRIVEFPVGNDDLFCSGVYYQQFDIVLDSQLDTLLSLEAETPGYFRIVSMSDCRSLTPNDSVFICAMLTSSMENKPGVMKRFLEGWSKFVIQMTQQKEECRTYLAEQFNLGPGYHNLIDFPDMQPWYRIDCDAAQVYINRAINRNELSQSIKLQSLLAHQ